MKPPFFDFERIAVPNSRECAIVMFAVGTVILLAMPYAALSRAAINFFAANYVFNGALSAHHLTRWIRVKDD